MIINKKINKKINKNINKKVIHLISILLKCAVVVFLLWFYYDSIHTEHSCFTFLFFIFPLFISLGIIYFSNMSIIYAFFIGFVIQWILFLNVNPYPLEIDNKYAIMNHIPSEYRPEEEFLLENLSQDILKNMKYPIIIKPITCSGGGSGIYILNSYDEYLTTINNTPDFDLSEYMVQKYLDGYDIEIGVLYEHKPWKKTGEVIEIIEKTQKELIRPREDGFTVNHPELITENVNILFNEISQKIPNFYAGRYDIRLKHLDDLEKGNFKIMEVNGTMGMRLISNFNLLNLHDLYYDFIWYWTRIIIGGYNMATLRGYGPLNLLRVMWISLSRAIGCNTWENLFSLYS